MPRDEFSPASVPGAWLAFFLAALIFPVAVIACAGDEPDTIADVLTYLASEYTRPIVEAKTPVLCEFVDPRTENLDCAALVATVEDSNPALDRARIRLRVIEARVFWREVEAKAILNDGIAALVLVDQADELLIDGWKGGDIDTWREGWTLSREGSGMWVRFVQDIYRYAQELESPSASDQ